MATISVTNINDGDAVTAASINNQINTIVNDYNGNITAANLATNAVTTAKVTAANITDAKLVKGKIAQRQGGTTGVASWRTTGTSNTDTSATDILIQVGSIGTDAASDVTVTFPTAFTQQPVVVCSVHGNNAGTGAITANCFAEVTNVTTTTAVFRTFNTGGGQSNQAVGWVAYGI